MSCYFRLVQQIIQLTQSKAKHVLVLSKHLVTDLIKDTTHPVKENFKEVSLVEWEVQITLLKRLWVSPPVPPLADATVVPELRIIHPNFYTYTSIVMLRKNGHQTRNQNLNTF